RGPPVAVYNFEVDGEHVYHVGTTGVLVHNSCQVVVIGERMSRVQNAVTYLRSQGVNARWYQAWGKIWPKNRALTDDELAANLARNGDWIRQKIRDGYVIVDIGTE